jgi:hypothetical protein
MHRNISLLGESIFLNSNESYYVIDGLYVNEIKSQIDKEQINKLTDSEIKERIFPYSNFPFAVFNTKIEEFKVQWIKKIDSTKYVRYSDDVFASDTGLLLVVKRDYFKEIIFNFDYYELVNSDKDEIDFATWEKLVQSYEIGDSALIISPGKNSGFDFSGSGEYTVEIV